MLRNLCPFFLCLLAFSMVVTTVTHARESYGVMELSCDGALHADGDSDQSPVDSNPSVQGHHGPCHGHNLMTFAVSAAHLPTPSAREAPEASGMSPLARRTVDPAIEPPRA